MGNESWPGDRDCFYGQPCTAQLAGVCCMLSSTMRIRRAWAAMMPAVEWLARTPYSSDSGGAGKGKRSSMCQQACSTGTQPIDS